MGRTRMEQQNSKKAKKYTAPSEELTRLQIRDDIRKMRNPKMHEIKNILRGIGLEQFVNHKAYIQTATHHQINYNLYNDDDVQFISQPPTKHRKKKNENIEIMIIMVII